MKTDNVLLVLCATLAVVLLINVGILVALLRSNSSGQLKVIGKTIQAIRHPLGKNNEDLKELRKRIAKLEDQITEDSTHESG